MNSNLYFVELLTLQGEGCMGTEFKFLMLELFQHELCLVFGMHCN